MTDDMGAIFREELRDLLESLERGLLDLKKRPDDMALINQVFRDLHTVKGSGAMFGFTDLAAFIHEFETVFDRIRSGALAVGAEILRLALAAKDEIPGLVEGEPDPDGQRMAILDGLRALIGGAPAAAAEEDAPAEVAESAPGPTQLRFRLSGAALAMGARPEIVLDELRAMGAAGIVADVAEVPALDRLDVEACAIGWSMDLPAGVTEAQVEEVFLFVDADCTLERAAAPAADAVKAGPDAGAASMAAPAPREVQVQSKSEIKAEAGATIRVPAERLDSLMDAVGELVIVEARLTELARESRDPALICRTVWPSRWSFP